MFGRPLKEQSHQDSVQRASAPSIPAFGCFCSSSHFPSCLLGWTASQVHASSPDYVQMKRGDHLHAHLAAVVMLREQNFCISDGRLGGDADPQPVDWEESFAAANSRLLLVQPDPSRRLHGLLEGGKILLDAGSQSRYLCARLRTSNGQSIPG